MRCWNLYSPRALVVATTTTVCPPGDATAETSAFGTGTLVPKTTTLPGGTSSWLVSEGTGFGHGEPPIERLKLRPVPLCCEQARMLPSPCEIRFHDAKRTCPGGISPSSCLALVPGASSAVPVTLSSTAASCAMLVVDLLVTWAVIVK